MTSPSNPLSSSLPCPPARGVRRRHGSRSHGQRGGPVPVSEQGGVHLRQALHMSGGSWRPPRPSRPVPSPHTHRRTAAPTHSPVVRTGGGIVVQLTALSHCSIELPQQTRHQAASVGLNLCHQEKMTEQNVGDESSNARSAHTSGGLSCTSDNRQPKFVAAVRVIFCPPASFNHTRPTRPLISGIMTSPRGPRSERPSGRVCPLISAGGPLYSAGMEALEGSAPDGPVETDRQRCVGCTADAGLPVDPSRILGSYYDYSGRGWDGGAPSGQHRATRAGKTFLPVASSSQARPPGEKRCSHERC